MISYFSSIS